MKKRLNARSVMVMVTSSSGVLVAMVKEKLIAQSVAALAGNIATGVMGQGMKTAHPVVDEEGLIAFRVRVLDARSVPVAMDMGLTHGAINADGAGGRGYVDCPLCNGTGIDECFSCNGTGHKDCSWCCGRGYKDCDQCNGSTTIECERCAGGGDLRAECSECDGKGRLLK